jgi:hypothetical protein
MRAHHFEPSVNVGKPDPVARTHGLSKRVWPRKCFEIRFFFSYVSLTFSFRIYDVPWQSILSAFYMLSLQLSPSKISFDYPRIRDEPLNQTWEGVSQRTKEEYQ